MTNATAPLVFFFRRLLAAPLGLALAAGLFAGCTRLDSETVAFDGRAVEVVEAGEGDATVVFESGLGDDWRHWDKVANDVADYARVFAYSRPGYGKSDPTTAPRDPGTIVEELRELLLSEGYAPPYVLVGHSFGGTYMELFAKSHPDEVEAAVLIEPRPTGFLDACEAEGLDMCGITSEQLARQPDVLVAEYEAFPEGAAEMEDAGTFGESPVRVLTGTRTPGTSDERQVLWMSMQGAIAGEAADGQQIVFDGGRHYLQVQEPHGVTDVILGLLP
jgi:pimeloyl-ACP methyl ester carboxylesterase